MNVTRATGLAWTLALGMILALLPRAAPAQTLFGGESLRGMAIGLLGSGAIGKELKLSDEQREKLAELKSMMLEESKKAILRNDDKKLEELMKQYEKEIVTVLKPEQVKRLKQVTYQRAGAVALTDSDIEKALALTKDQKQQVKKLSDDLNSQANDLLKARDGETQKKMQALLRSSAQKAANVLTEEQRVKWEVLQGEPFTEGIAVPSGDKGKKL